MVDLAERTTWEVGVHNAWYRAAATGRRLSVAAIVAALAACSSAGGSSTSHSVGVTVNTTPAAATGHSARTVTVTETEFKIAMSRRRFTPGKYTFIAHNRGSLTHALEIDGPGVHDEATPILNPGQAATLTVTMRSGTYDIFCPVGSHKDLGMNLHITVP